MFLSNVTSKIVVTETKVITGNQNVDFVSMAPFEVNEKIISDENVVDAITCDFPCKILLKNHSVGKACQKSPYYKKN